MFRPARQHLGSRRRVAALVVGIVTVLGLGAIVLMPRESMAARLSALPEASLVYPGSTLITSGSRNGQTGQPAVAWRMFGSDASVEDILAFYTDELASSGFAPGAAGLITRGFGEELRACGWNRGEVVFRLSFWYPEAFARMFPNRPVSPTTYELRIIHRPDIDPSSKQLCTYVIPRSTPVASPAVHASPAADNIPHRPFTMR